MEVIVYNTAEEIGEAIGKIFVDTVNAKHDTVLGLATGASPIPTYDYIAKAYEAGEVSLKDVTTFNLDEYCDLPREDKNSFYSFMVENLFSRTDIDMNKVNFLNGNAADVDAECARYDSAIEASGGIDLQILGIGTDGHIGFNEPADHFSEKSFRIQLEQSTIDSNQKYFGDVPMPRYAVTMGIRQWFFIKPPLTIKTRGRYNEGRNFQNRSVAHEAPEYFANHLRSTALLHAWSGES